MLLSQAQGSSPLLFETLNYNFITRKSMLFFFFLIKKETKKIKAASAKAEILNARTKIEELGAGVQYFVASAASDSFDFLTPCI